MKTKPRHPRVKLRQKLDTLKKALKDYANHCDQVPTRIQETDAKDAACSCSACTGGNPPATPSVEELSLPEDDPDGVKCDRCGRYVWNDCGNERLRCPTTGEWLCSLCSNVECPYPNPRTRKETAK